MTYIYTSEEVQTIADVIAKFLTKHKYKVSFEVPLNKEASYRTTLLAKKEQLSILVEAQKKPICNGSLIGLARWLQNEMEYCELYIVTDEHASFTGSFLTQLDYNGIGLIVVDDNKKLKIIREPKNPPLIVHPDPTLKYGPYKPQVQACLDNFNAPNSFLTTRNPRKEALSEMCDIVESLTNSLAILSVKKGLLKCKEADINSKDWSSVIDALASKNAYVCGENPIISNDFKFDLHSFRGARNLLKHPVKSKREETQRQKQYAERMMMGPRLVADLVSIKSCIAKKKKINP